MVLKNGFSYLKMEFGENKTKDIMCPECYSSYNRITPLLKPENCLINHRQYVCSICGRCICSSVDEKGKYRAMFPFKTLNIAKLYLRSAEVITEKSCGIYEIEDDKGRKQYKIFSSQYDLKNYLNKNKDKKSLYSEPLFKTSEYRKFNESQIRILSSNEVEKYMDEWKKQKPNTQHAV